MRTDCIKSGNKNLRGSQSSSQASGRCWARLSQQEHTGSLKESQRRDEVRVKEQTVQRGDHSSLVSESDAVLGVGREKTLEDSSGGVENRCALTANLHANVNFLEVDDLVADTLDVG
jgi:hypothetical protein